VLNLIIILRDDQLSKGILSIGQKKVPTKYSTRSYRICFTESKRSSSFVHAAGLLLLLLLLFEYVVWRFLHCQNVERVVALGVHWEKYFIEYFVCVGRGADK